MTGDTRNIWSKFLAGNHRAFEQLYQLNVDKLYDYGIRLCQDPNIVEDSLQEMFTQLWIRRDVLPEVASVTGYLLVALRRRILRVMSSNQRLQHPVEDLYGNFNVDFNPHISDTISEDVIAQLKSAFSKLTDKQKEVVYLKFYNNLNYDEIAEVLDVTTKSVYKLMSRAINSMRIQVDLTLLPLILSALF